MKKRNREQQTVRDWILANRGFQAAVAAHCGKTRSYVCGVLNKKIYSPNGLVEGILADLGAPGMRERQREAKAKARQITWTDREKSRLLQQIKDAKGKKGKAA